MSRSLAIFATGDALRVVTITANTGFIRAAAGQGVTFATVTHESRALTEDKEKTAAPLEGGGCLLLVLGEGPGLVGHGGEGDALARRRPDEAGVGGDGDNPQCVPCGEDGQRPAH